MSQLPPYNNLFTMLGLDNLPAEKKEEMFQQMQEIVNDRVGSRIGSMLSDEDKEIFASLETEEDTMQFLQEKKIDGAAIAAEEAQKFREELMMDSSFIEGKLRSEQDKGNTQA